MQLPVPIALSGVCLFIILVATTNSFVEADDVIMPNGMDHTDLERFYDPRRKRPFCNAFTGCGKKRSDDSMATLVELNSEPAVDELNRQILSEAKLWEAIQEARGELLRRHHEKAQQQSGHEQQGLSSMQLPLPLAAFRRRRSVSVPAPLLPSSYPRRGSTGIQPMAIQPMGVQPMDMGRYY